MARRPRRRPLRALGAGVTAAALLAGGGQAIAAPDTTLDFTEAIDGTLPDADGQGTGFTTWLEGSGDDPTKLDLVTAGDGLLNVTTTGGDAAASPSSQDNALAVTVDGSGGYVVEGVIEAPVDLTQPLQSAGIFVGVDQNNYVKVVARKSNASVDQMQLLIERQDEDPTTPFETEESTVVNLPSADSVNLRLSVAADGAVLGEYHFGDGNWQTVDTFTLAAAAGSDVEAGIIHTHSGTATPFVVGYDSFAVDVPPGLVSLTPADGADDVPLDGAVTATFDQPMDEDTVAPAFTLAPADAPGSPVAGAVGLDSTGTVATFTPSAPLESRTAYVATVSEDAADTTGFGLAAAASATFTTAAAAVTPPPPPPPPPTGGTAGTLCATVPPRAIPGGGSGTIRLTPAQLLINQRISQAAVRRSNAVQDWLAAGIATQDLCGGGLAPGAFTGVSFGPAGATAAAEPASPRPITIASAAGGGGDPIVLSAEQLLINQRISQAAVRRSNALLARLDAGLTGGDVRDGAVTAGKLAPGVTVTATAATPPVPPSTTRIAAATPGSGDPVSATVAQLRINQRISQAAVRRSNALIDRLSRGLTGADFQAGSLNATDLAPGLRQPPAS